ncbi:hypothetical protein ACFRAO_43665 [Streptomyces sp. NPDC056656]
MSSSGRGLRRTRGALLMSGIGLLQPGSAQLFESGADRDVL